MIVLRLAVAMVVLGACGWLTAGRPMGAFSTAAPQGGAVHVPARGDHVRLLVQRRYESSLRLFDPETLTPVHRGQLLTAGPWKSINPPQFMASEDGSRIAALYYPPYTYPDGYKTKQIEVRIFDARTGRLLHHFHPAVPLSIDGISSNGAELFGGTAGAIRQDGSWVSSWYALSAASGHVVRSDRSIVSSCCPISVTDPAGHALYELVTENQPKSGPGTARLLAFDLVSGREIGSLDLNRVAMGTWSTGEYGSIADRYVRPGLALSPDGRTVAVFDGTTNLLVLVNAQTLQVIRSETVQSQPSALAELAAGLGLAPSVAEAKGAAGIERDLAFAPDGSALYITGWDGTEPTPGTYVFHDTGILRADVATGFITAWISSQPNTPTIHLAPDGSAVYAFDSNDNTLTRYDATTLRQTARRIFVHAVTQVFVLPASH